MGPFLGHPFWQFFGVCWPLPPELRASSAPTCLATLTAFSMKLKFASFFRNSPLGNRGLADSGRAPRQLRANVFGMPYSVFGEFCVMCFQAFCALCSHFPSRKSIPLGFWPSSAPAPRQRVWQPLQRFWRIPCHVFSCILCLMPTLPSRKSIPLGFGPSSAPAPHQRFWYTLQCVGQILCHIVTAIVSHFFTISF